MLFVNLHSDPSVLARRLLALASLTGRCSNTSAFKPPFLMRDDFSKPVKALLARRVGFRCSFPDCDAPTVGPAEAENESVMLGEAAHITGAAPGGARHNKDLSSEARSSSTNGIWMCRPHAKLIDDDESYSVATLEAWKLGAEERARRAILLQSGPKTLNLDLAHLGPQGPVNEALGTVLERCGVATAWGRSEYGCIQDLLIEVARNALEHGGAQSVGIVAEPYRLTLYDDGSPFDPLRELGGDTRSGGRVALTTIRRLHALDLLTSYRHRGGMNQLDIVRVEGLGASVPKLTPCTLTLGLQESRSLYYANEQLDISDLHGCGDVVVILPPFVVISDALVIGELLRRAFPGDVPQLHLVLTKSSDTVLEMLQSLLPTARFLRRR